MSKLLEAMKCRIKEIVIEEHRPFSFGNFRRFEVDGQEYKMSHGTYRNYLVKLKKNKEIEFAFNSGAAYYTLPGKKFTKSMTGDRMGGVSILICRKKYSYLQMDQETTGRSNPSIISGLYFLQVKYGRHFLVYILIRPIILLIWISSCLPRPSWRILTLHQLFIIQIL